LAENGANLPVVLLVIDINDFFANENTILFFFLRFQQVVISLPSHW